MNLKSVKAWLSIIRIGNSIALGIAAVVGYIVGGGMNVYEAAKTFLAAFFIGGGGNIINDYFDREVDAINKPWRPIPSGLIKPFEAYVAALMFFLIGFAIALSSSYFAGIVALLAIVLVYFYSYSLKRVLLVGNISIAFLTALSIVYGSLFSSVNIHVFLAATYAFLFNLGREFLKGIEDVEGDKRFGIKTLATVYGVVVAFKASALIYGVLLAVSLLPIAILRYSIVYTLLALVVDAVIIYSILNAKTLRPADALRSTRVLKIAAFAGLFAFLFHSI
ncbi:MAG: geranylgeranylglycerol-phosphate geranylgeranyltransferase [Ignisphaera sp.]